MITRVAFPGIDYVNIDKELDYIDQDVSFPIYSTHRGTALDTKDIASIVGKLLKVYKNDKGGYNADIDTFSRVLEEFKCELVYTAGIWVATLDEEDTPKIKPPPGYEVQSPMQTARNGMSYQRAQPVIPETPSQQHAFPEPECVPEMQVEEIHSLDTPVSELN